MVEATFSDDRRRPISSPRGVVRKLCGAAAVISTGAVVLTDIAAILAVKYSTRAGEQPYHWVSDTVSNLAAGPNAWIQNWGFLALAAGILALAAGWVSTRLPWTRVLGGVFILETVGLISIVTYARLGTHGVDIMGIHVDVVAGLAVLFFLSCVLVTRAIWGRLRGWAVGSLCIAIVWAISAPLYGWVPDAFTGLYERYLGCIVLFWVAFFGAILFSRRTAPVFWWDTP